jgi:hypothetical protein
LVSHCFQSGICFTRSQRGTGNLTHPAFARRGGAARPRATHAARLEVLAPPPGRVYICDMTTPTQRPEFEPDQIAQTVSVGLCFVLADVLLVLVLVYRLRTRRAPAR